MTQLKKRATALLLGSVTFFIALAMPYNTTRVYAADVAFSWVVNESSNTILNWILLYLGISVAPEAISEGKVFDKTGQFAMDFCQEFFGDTFEQWYVSNGFSEDIDTFKREFNDILTQDFDAAKYVAGDIKSSVLDVVSRYLNTFDSVKLNDLSSFQSIAVGSSVTLDYLCRYKFIGASSFLEHSLNSSVKIFDNSNVYPVVVVDTLTRNVLKAQTFLISANSFNYEMSYYPNQIKSAEFNEKFYFYYAYAGGVSSGITTLDDMDIISNISHVFIDGRFVSNFDVFSYLKGLLVSPVVPDIPNVAGKDWAFDLVGWPDAWDVDKPDVKPWDDVDSLPIPGDIAIPKEIPGVTDLPGIMDGVIGGTIPWPDIIDIIKDLPVDPTPDPDKPTEPDPDPELPEIPAVLPQGVSDKLKDLSGKFPFCIPFDLVDCFKSFGSNEAVEAPKWDFTFKIPGTNKDYEFSVDLSMFDKYIPIFRSGVLILFLIGLIIGTRKLIGWQVKN